MNLRALLIDGGATLFPEGPTVPEFALIGPAKALSSLLPELERDQIKGLLRQMSTLQDETERAQIQLTDALTAERLEEIHPGLEDRAPALRRALVRGGWPTRQPYPGDNSRTTTSRELGPAPVPMSKTPCGGAAGARTGWAAWKAEFHAAKRSEKRMRSR